MGENIQEDMGKKKYSGYGKEGIFNPFQAIAEAVWSNPGLDLMMSKGLDYSGKDNY